MKIILFFIFAICFFQNCEKDYSTLMDDFYSYSENEDLYLKVESGTIEKPGKFEIINKSKQDIYIPYQHYASCSFFLFGLHVQNNGNWKSLNFEENSNKWVSFTHPDSVFIICDMFMLPIKLMPNQKYQGEIEGTVEQSGTYELMIKYSFKEDIICDDCSALSFVFKVIEE